jgi:hypothetical protein
VSGVWANPVGVTESFEADLALLLPEYPELETVVDAFKSALGSYPKLTRIPLDETSVEDDLSGIYVHLLDYPPLNILGVQLFRISYWAPPKLLANTQMRPRRNT